MNLQGVIITLRNEPDRERETLYVFTWVCGIQKMKQLNK